MHKKITRANFLGKKFFFLPKCHSTNAKLTALLQKEQLLEGFFVFTNHQTRGKGRRKKKWLDEPKKDILISILLRPSFLSPQFHFYLNFIVSLAVKNLVQSIAADLKNIKVKWPNDVFINNKKVAGILIENTLQGNIIQTSVVGIGLNLNSTLTPPKKATSVFLETRHLFERNVVIEKLLLEIENKYEQLKQNQIEAIVSEYVDSMMWRDERRTFETYLGKITGQIVGIDEQGKIKIRTDNQYYSFNIDEISF